MTILRGRIVMREGARLGTPQGAPVRFLDTMKAQ
jgi:hypothetical protein